MSIKEGFFARNSHNNVISKDKSKARVGKSLGVSGGSVVRKGLADITNMQDQPRPWIMDENTRLVSASTVEYINELKKENMTLMKILADRNKIIELSGVELHKLRINLQKLQQQNSQLVQSNSQMLGELNSSKDRLKLVQHELGCKKGLVIAKGLEIEENEETFPSHKGNNEVEMLNCEETMESSENATEKVKPSNTNRKKQSKSLGSSKVKRLEDIKANNKRFCLRRQSARFKSEEASPAEDLFVADSASLGSGSRYSYQKHGDVSTSKCLLVENEDNIANKKRLPARRQSARFKSEEAKPVEDLFDVDSSRLLSGPLHNQQMREEGSISICLSIVKDDNEVKSPQSDPAEDIGRPSIGRPSRQAAKKVNTYKEAPLNVKMRRSE